MFSSRFWFRSICISKSCVFLKYKPKLFAFTITRLMADCSKCQHFHLPGHIFCVSIKIKLEIMDLNRVIWEVKWKTGFFVFLNASSLTFQICAGFGVGSNSQLLVFWIFFLLENIWRSRRKKFISLSVDYIGYTGKMSCWGK